MGYCSSKCNQACMGLAMVSVQQMVIIFCSISIYCFCQTLYSGFQRQKCLVQSRKRHPLWEKELQKLTFSGWLLLNGMWGVFCPPGVSPLQQYVSTKHWEHKMWGSQFKQIITTLCYDCYDGGVYKPTLRRERGPLGKLEKAQGHHFKWDLKNEKETAGGARIAKLSSSRGKGCPIGGANLPLFSSPLPQSCEVFWMECRI